MRKQEMQLTDKTLLDTPKDKEFLTLKMLAKDPICPFSEKALRFHVWRSAG